MSSETVNPRTAIDPLIEWYRCEDRSLPIDEVAEAIDAYAKLCDENQSLRTQLAEKEAEAAVMREALDKIGFFCAGEKRFHVVSEHCLKALNSTSAGKAYLARMEEAVRLLKRELARANQLYEAAKLDAAAELKSRQEYQQRAFELAGVLQKWRAYFQSTETDPETRGEQFSDAWFSTEKAISPTQTPAAPASSAAPSTPSDTASPPKP